MQATVKDALEQYEFFNNGKTVTPIVLGRYEKTKAETEEEKKARLEQQKKEGEEITFFDELDQSIVLSINTVFYLLTEEQELVKVFISNSLVASEESCCEVEKVGKINKSDLKKLSSLYVYDDVYTKPITTKDIQDILVQFGNYGDEKMKALYILDDITKEAFWKKYGE